MRYFIQYTPDMKGVMLLQGFDHFSATVVKNFGTMRQAWNYLKSLGK